MRRFITKHPDSSLIKDVLYDRDTKRLFLTLVRSRLYCYHDVPEDIVNEFLSSQSLGRFFNAYIVRFRNNGIEPEDTEYVALYSAAKEEELFWSNDLLPIRQNVNTVPFPMIKNKSQRADQLHAYWEDSEHMHVGSPSCDETDTPFIFRPLANPSAYPELVVKVQGVFRNCFKSYQCPVGRASNMALQSQNRLGECVPTSAFDYLQSILRNLDVVITVKDPRKSKAGDCRINRIKRNAAISINKNVNKYKFLCVLLHEIAHAMNHVNYSAHDDVWKSIYSTLLADFYRFFPDKYRNELQWGMLYAPATINARNFNGRGILFGCACEEPSIFFDSSIDVAAEKCEYDKMVQRYAIGGHLQIMKLWVDKSTQSILTHISGKIAKEVIINKIEDRSLDFTSFDRMISYHLRFMAERELQRVIDAVKAVSDMMIRCWVKYNPLLREHTNIFTKCYLGGNDFIDELTELVSIK